ncbi:uncharacterized protein LOC127244192 [Andrographis paniculata]|uniref:uncharacterized protein LOC127244192 n=1 Tax=Andrographis paniculata TaxID=175694 RepID=UPI0021E8CC90|nr:uncharacterized protein LOC127244192 [Andrographis paniculata]
MAIAGLHNVSAFGPSFFGEGRREQPSTRASTLLQIWREIEGEHAVNQSYRSRQPRNGSDSECLSTSTSFERGSDNGDDISQHSDESENQGFTGSEMDPGENGSIASEQSSDLGEIERERVRQIFREWMNSGSKGPPSYELNLNNCSGQWLGETECQRVRIIREWVQANAQQRNNCGSVRDGVAQSGSQLEQVRDGLAISHSEIGQRKHIRRLCGRQTLLDLLLRAQSERKNELVALSGRRPVSDFAHRNRIQALLRGRFLRDQSSVIHERTSSHAATELSLLRQRHTVSDLREEFLSKLENSASASANTAKCDCSSIGDNNEESDSPRTRREVARLLNLQTVSDVITSPHEQATETEDHGFDNDGREQERSNNGSASCVEEPASAMQQEVFTADANSNRDELINAVSNETSTESEGIHSNGHGRSERNVNEEADDLHDPISPLEEFQEPGIETPDSSRQQVDTVASTELVNPTEVAVGSLGESTSNQWSPGTSQNNGEEHQDQVQESHGDWPSQDFEEAIDNWLDDTPTRAESESFGRTDPTYYFPDDDNAHSMELRELFSRRRVSSLLGSGFRESLNQVLQSHVERLGHASDDWELENSPPEQDQEQLTGDQNLPPTDNSERNQFAPSSNYFTSEILWGAELQPASWPRHISNQQLGTEWEVINELRLDMARLQQRMDNMQSMLEACMDMQIELQRAVRQEVSAALNRSTFATDAGQQQQRQVHDGESQWDHVRKGICCLCQDSKINSLLYRCGHMCSCSKCAENLVREKGKCPMCEAPVVEVVRAYFVQ